MLKRESNLFEQFERIAEMCKASGTNLTNKAVASAVVNAVLADALDAISSHKDETGKQNHFDLAGLEWLVSDDKAAIATRQGIRDVIQSTFTAPKNFQNTYLAHKDIALMAKVEGQKDTSEFI